VRTIVRLSLRFRYLVIAGAVALMFFGAQTLGHQKIDVFPEFAPISVEIQTECLGLSPQEVESLVTVPLENALQGVPRVTEIESESVPQLSAIFLYFKNGTDVLQARQLVQERLAQASPTLPSWAAPPSLYPIVSATSRVMQVGITSTKIDPLDLSKIAFYTIRPRLLHVPGVANVAMWGETKKEIQVLADPSKLDRRKVPLSSLMNAADTAVDNGLLSFTTGASIGSGGWIETANQRLGIRNSQVITSPQQLAQVPVAKRGSQTLTIGDLARVQYGTPPLIGTAVVNGGPGIMLVIEKFPDANTIDVTNGILKAFQTLEPGLPGINVNTHIFRQANFIHTAIHNLTFAVILGCILVVFVLLAFLFQWRAAFVSLLAIPLSLAAAGIVLSAEGAEINTMILAGFGVAVGVVVDDAIIDMENIVRRLRNWRARGRRTTPLHLLLAASLEVRTAILYATLINIVAVLPVVFVGGLTGSFFRPLAIAYGLAVLASMVIALTVTPALAMVLMPSARLHAGDPPVIAWCKRQYRKALAPAIKRPIAAIVAIVAAIIAGALVLPNLGQDLFPTFKEQDLLMHFDTKPGTSLPEMKRVVERLQQQFLKLPGHPVVQVGSHIGQALLGEEIAGPEFSEQWITLSPHANLEKTEQQVRDVTASFPGTYLDLTTYLHERIDETITTDTEDIVVRILGPNFGTLQRLSQEITNRLNGTPHLVDLHPQSQGFVPQIQETVNAPAAARYGLTPGDVRRQAATIFGSQELGELWYGGIAIGVSGWSIPSARASLSDLQHLLIDTPNGGHVPLDKVANLVVNTTPSDITRVDNSNKIDVEANVSGSGNLGSATSAVQARLAHIKLPDGYHIQLLGEGAVRAAAQRRLLLMGLGAAVAILFLLQAAFQSVRLATMMFVTLPVALVGGVLAAWLFVGEIDLGALVGFFAVLGIAARNGILMISHLQHLEDREGEPFGRQLVLRGAGERLSPILMTALATGLALAPFVIFGDRPGQEIENPMAIVILGGLATSSLMNLFVLPSLYLRFAHGRAPQEPMPEDPGDSDEPPIDPNGDGSGSEPLQVSLQA
jgi:CzcA family heavy metal efflux pump